MADSVLREKAKEFAKNLGIEVCDTAKALGFLRD